MAHGDRQMEIIIIILMITILGKLFYILWLIFLLVIFIFIWKSKLIGIPFKTIISFILLVALLYKLDLIHIDFSTNTNSEHETVVESNTVKPKINQKDLKNKKKYIINELLEKYNTIAEYPVDNQTMFGIIDIDRPVSRFTYTFTNGVYIIITYSESSNRLFIDYYDDASSDDSLYVIFRDFIKTIDSTITNEDVKIAWEDLKTGNYQGYTEYDLQGVKCNYSANAIIEGSKRYIIKTSFQK